MKKMFYLIDSVQKLVQHTQSALARNHSSQVVLQLKCLLTEVVHYTKSSIDCGEKSSASGVSHVVDLTHQLDNGFLQGHLGPSPTRQ